MNQFTTKKSLTAPRRQLLEMQLHPYCRIENLEVSGEPVFEPATCVAQDIKVGDENGSRPELSKLDFPVHAAIIEFFEHLNQMGESQRGAQALSFERRNARGQQ